MNNKLLLGLILVAVITITSTTESYAASLSMNKRLDKVNTYKNEQELTNITRTPNGNLRYTEDALIEDNTEVDKKIHSVGRRVIRNNDVIRGNGKADSNRLRVKTVRE